jgi:hypothetical protein
MGRQAVAAGFIAALKPFLRVNVLSQCRPPVCSDSRSRIMDVAVLIPIIAIIGTFSVPVTAIVMDYRRRKLQFEERRAMIEKGMQPPPLEEMQSRGGRFHRDPAVRRERSLFTGISMLFLGIGLGVGAWLLQNVVSVSFMPKSVAGPMTVGAAVLLFIGLGNLVYFAITAKSAGARTQ